MTNAQKTIEERKREGVNRISKARMDNPRKNEAQIGVDSIALDNVAAMKVWIADMMYFQFRPWATGAGFTEEMAINAVRESVTRAARAKGRIEEKAWREVLDAVIPVSEEKSLVRDGKDSIMPAYEALYAEIRNGNAAKA